MALIIEAIRELLKDAGLYQAANLINRMEASDLRDGMADACLDSWNSEQVHDNCGQSYSCCLQR